MATSFKIRLSKNQSQQTITIRRDDNVDLSAVSSIIAYVYTDDLGTADNTYTLTTTEVSEFVDGSVSISTDDLIGESPEDEFYLVKLEGNSAAYVSDDAGIGITLEMINKGMTKQGVVDVYSPDYRISDRLMLIQQLIRECDSLENQDSSDQKRADFITRQDQLKKLLNY